MEENFGLDKPLELKNTVRILDKSVLENNPAKFWIRNLQPGKWEKLQVVLTDVEDEEVSLDLPNTLHNELIKMFGNVPKNWLGKEIVLESEKTSFKDRETGRTKNGYRIFFSELTDGPEENQELDTFDGDSPGAV